jgi:predicted nucleic acid-binding protein
MIQIDADVLIEFVRRNLDAAHRLDQLPIWRLSAIAWMELLQGCHSRSEVKDLQQMMSQRLTEYLPVTPMITDRAVRLITIHASTTGLRLADALIAATAMEHDHTLLTANVKHFRPIEGLRIERFEMRSQPSVKSVHEDQALYNLETVYRVVELEG